MIRLSEQQIQVLELTATGHLFTTGGRDEDLNELLCAFLIRRERPAAAHGRQRLILTRAGREALEAACVPA